MLRPAHLLPAARQASNDSRELVRVLLELDVPHYHHELVKDALQVGRLGLCHVAQACC
jgi:hypothetical protein